MSFLDNFSQWSKLDPKNQRAKPTQMTFPTFNRKIRKKKLWRHSFILSING